MILAPQKETGRTALETPAAHSTAHTQNCTDHTSLRQRLPAYGRRLRDALDAGYRPRKGGGAIIVTSDWDYARAFDPGRVVCPAGESVDSFDFSFLRGCHVIVLVPEADELHGEALFATIHDAGAASVVLSIKREVE